MSALKSHQGILYRLQNVACCDMTSVHECRVNLYTFPHKNDNGIPYPADLRYPTVCVVLTCHKLDLWGYAKSSLAVSLRSGWLCNGFGWVRL